MNGLIFESKTPGQDERAKVTKPLSDLQHDFLLVVRQIALHKANRGDFLLNGAICRTLRHGDAGRFARTRRAQAQRRKEQLHYHRHRNNLVRAGTREIDFIEKLMIKRPPSARRKSEAERRSNWSESGKTTENAQGKSSGLDLLNKNSQAPARGGGKRRARLCGGNEDAGKQKQNFRKENGLERSYRTARDWKRELIDKFASTRRAGEHQHLA